MSSELTVEALRAAEKTLVTASRYIVVDIIVDETLRKVRAALRAILAAQPATGEGLRERFAHTGPIETADGAHVHRGVVVVDGPPDEERCRLCWKPDQAVMDAFALRVALQPASEGEPDPVGPHAFVGAGVCSREYPGNTVCGRWPDHAIHALQPASGDGAPDHE